MTAPKNREQLITAIARIIDDKNDFDWNAILAALEEVGCTVVPVQATKKMLRHADALDCEHASLSNGEALSVGDVHKAMLAASPYRNGGER